MVIASSEAAGIGILILIALYFLPTIVAASCKSSISAAL
jgi:hypothetical protein